MNPLLFPVVLILYADGSHCAVTRKVARVILYSYLLTFITTTYLYSQDAANLSLLLIHTACYLACITLCQKLTGKVAFFLLMLGVWWIDMGIILGTLQYDIKVFGYSLLSYSNYFYRELTILAVGLCSYVSTTNERHNTRENLLGLSALLMWIVEKHF
jgi:hypothetical protein